MSGADALYREIILEHNQDPRNFGIVDSPDFVHEGFNPLCGDRIFLSVKLSKNKQAIEDCQFEGEGCSICMASSSMMTESVRGHSLHEVREQIAKFRSLMQGEEDPETVEGDIAALSGVRRFPVRIKCALLSWISLRDALDRRCPMGLETEPTKTE